MWGVDSTNSVYKMPGYPHRSPRKTYAENLGRVKLNVDSATGPGSHRQDLNPELPDLYPALFSQLEEVLSLPLSRVSTLVVATGLTFQPTNQTTQCLGTGSSALRCGEMWGHVFSNT